jgi:hypothetical protein
MNHSYIIIGEVKTGKKSKIDFELAKFSNVSQAIITKNKFRALVHLHFDATKNDLQNVIGGVYSDYKIKKVIFQN